MNGQRNVAAAFRLHLLDEASAVGNDERFVPLLDQILADFQRAAFDASGIEFGEYLNDFHGGCSKRIPAKLATAYVR